MPTSEQTFSYLLRFQIGPVQDFIAQARSTRDLWSGSYLLSWLVAAGIRHFLAKEGTALIFPNPEGQPLLDPNLLPDARGLLTPNLPNIFVGTVQGDVTQLGKEIHDAIQNEWLKIADNVWQRRKNFQLLDGAKARFDAQVKRHLSISWQFTPSSGIGREAYISDYRLNGWQLDAVRQTRDFTAWSTGGWETTGCEKDSLSGREEAVVGGKEWQALVSKDYAQLFKHSDHLGAVNLIKRVWHRTFFMQRNEGFKVPQIKAALGRFNIRSTRAIAARDDKADDDENVETEPGERYLAAIAFDGDSIGKWVSGDFLPVGSDLHAFHQKFSGSLSNFALGTVRIIVEEEHEGFLIYAGGDDVIALVPADVVLECAEALHTAFCGSTEDILGQDHKGKAIRPDASVGIAIAHFKSPLQDLIRAAQAAEKHAKNTIGRPAFSVTLMKRSGETDVWGAKWDSGGIALHIGIAKAMNERRISGKFPHRVCELLAPFRTSRTGISRQQDVADFQAHAVILREFAHTIDRQRLGKGAAELLPLLDAYLTAIGTDPQTCLSAVIGLCKSVVFTQRNRPSQT